MLAWYLLLYTLKYVIKYILVQRIFLFWLPITCCALKVIYIEHSWDSVVWLLFTTISYCKGNNETSHKASKTISTTQNYMSYDFLPQNKEKSQNISYPTSLGHSSFCCLHKYVMTMPSMQSHIIPSYNWLNAVIILNQCPNSYILICIICYQS